MNDEKITALLGEILAELRKLNARPAPTLTVPRGNGSNIKAIADDADLDSQYGDPKVFYKARGWDGEDFKGRLVSECPVEFLEKYADQLDFIARDAEKKGEKTKGGDDRAPFVRKDAARVRGWIERKRRQEPAAAIGVVDGDGVEVSDELPF